METPSDQDHLMQRSCDRPSVIPSKVPEIIASELEKPKSSVQPVEDHAASPPADVQGNSEKRYPTRNRHLPGYLRD